MKRSIYFITLLFNNNSSNPCFHQLLCNPLDIIHSGQMIIAVTWWWQLCLNHLFPCYHNKLEQQIHSDQIQCLKWVLLHLHFLITTIQTSKQSEVHPWCNLIFSLLLRWAVTTPLLSLPHLLLSWYHHQLVLPIITHLVILDQNINSYNHGEVLYFKNKPQ